MSFAIEHVPVEIWERIARALPAQSLFNFVLSSRKVYKAANPQLYRSVHFFGTVARNKETAKSYTGHQVWRFGAHRAQSRLSYSDYSSSINNLDAFLRTITAAPALRSQILGSSFEWDHSATVESILLGRQCIQILTPSIRLLRLGLAGFDTDFAITTNVTFLEIVYPDEKWLNDDYEGNKYDVHLHKNLRDKLYSLFCIPTLQHLAVKHARTWQAFTPHFPSDNSRAGTSNVTTLSLPNTVPLSRDLREILTWPKALRRLYHENVSGRNDNFFQNYGSEEWASPQKFIEGLQCQRQSLEELVYYNCGDDSAASETTFGQALKEFVSLQRLSVEKDSLVDQHTGEPYMLYKTLPPKLEEAWLQVDSADVYKNAPRNFLKQELEEIARNKQECFPCLRELVVWVCDPDLGLYIRQSEYPAESRRILDELNLVPVFQEVGIRFDFVLSTPTSFRYSKSMD